MTTHADRAEVSDQRIVADWASGRIGYSNKSGAGVTIIDRHGTMMYSDIATVALDVTGADSRVWRRVRRSEAVGTRRLPIAFRPPRYCPQRGSHRVRGGRTAMNSASSNICSAASMAGSQCRRPVVTRADRYGSLAANRNSLNCRC